MATLENIAFEIERRNIIFHKNTTLPDDSQLNYIGNPNDIISAETDGELLLYNSPSGTLYLDKSMMPYKMQYKVEDGAGGLQKLIGDSGGDSTGGGDEVDPIFTAWDKSTGISITESQISDLGTYQPSLVSGTNIKTINGQTLLGSGDLSIDGSGGGGDINLGDLLDVDLVTAPPTMGQVLIYNTTSGKQIPSTIEGGGGSFLDGGTF